MSKPDAESDGAEGRDGSGQQRERPHEGQALQQDHDGRMRQGHEHGVGEPEVGPGNACSSNSSSYQILPEIPSIATFAFSA